MIHEIINPSDPYTIECDDMKLLTASIFILGEGNYATTSKDTDFQVPMTIFGPSGIEFFKEEFNEDLNDYIKNNKSLIADCLSTVCLGKISDRKIYFSSLEKIDDEQKKQEFIDEWYDKKQSSMNQIGQRAASIVKILKQQQKDKK